MLRDEIIKVIKNHSTISEYSIENFADHIMAVVLEHYDNLESQLAVKDLTLKSFGINRD